MMHRYQHKATLPAILMLMAVIILTLIVAFFNLPKQTTLPQGANMSIIGVALDQDEDFVDLHQLEKNGVSFVYLRGTQGKSYFDDNYLFYRDQVQGTSLDFGTIVTFSQKSRVMSQYRYFESKVGSNTGQLPILIVPAMVTSSPRYWQRMGQFTQLLQKAGKRVCVMGSAKWQKKFPKGTVFMQTGSKLTDKTSYSFWCYTQKGRVAHVNQLNQNVTMFAYIGTSTNYEQLYGKVTE